MRRYDYRLGRGRSSFIGYEPWQVAHLVSEADVSAAAKSPGIETLADCVFMPGHRALYSLDGARIEVTNRNFLDPDLPVIPSQARKLDRQAQQTAPSRIDVPARLATVDAEVILMGSAIAHYGHFITDSMARLWCLKELPAEAPVLYYRHQAGTPDYERVITRSLGRLDRRLTSPTVPTLFKSVLCPLPAIQLSRRIYANFDRPHRRVAAALKAAEAFTSPDRPVYLSRRGLGAGHRSLLGEDELEAKLEREGWLIVQPERLSFAEQVGLFNGHHPIAGCIGSAFHTVLFRDEPEPARLGMLTDRYVHQRFMLVDAVKAVESNYLCCMEGPPALDADEEPMLQSQEYRIDPDLALGLLAEAGLMTGPPPVGQPSPPTVSERDPPRIHVGSDLAVGEISVPRHHAFNTATGEAFQRGDMVRLFNGRDGEWWGRINTPVGNAVVVTVKGKIRTQTVSPAAELAVAVRSQAEALAVVERATELGASRVILLPSQATPPGPLDPAMLLRCATFTAARSGRLDVPGVEIGRSVSDLLDARSEGALFYWEEDPPRDIEEPAMPAKRTLPILKQLTVNQPTTLYALAVFPRNTLAPEERARLRALDWSLECSLGARRLSPEVAASALIAVWQARDGEFR